MNNEERISFLLKRYISNECSIDELRELFRLIDVNGSKEMITEELRSLWHDTHPERQHTDAQWEQLYDRMMETESSPAPVKQHKKQVWIKFSVAATVLIALSFSLYFYKHKEKSVKNQQLATSTALKPGTNTAILTLGNGTKVVLDEVNGKVTAQEGIQITKTAGGQLIYKLQDAGSSKDGTTDFNTIETPKGGQYQIIMSDGSKVWLNAYSSLKYPISFHTKERVVELKGEAYFEIAKNKRAPFKVISNNQIVEVLGTHFNINGYADEPDVKTTLLEGAVKVSSVKNNAHAMLIPGEQAILQGSRLEVNRVDTEEAVAWKNGYFTFNNSSLESVMRQVSRWYNVEVVYQNNEVKRQILSGDVSRFENAAQVLAILELTGVVHFKVEGRRIIAML
jgi:transmembrane sensor